MAKRSFNIRVDEQFFEDLKVIQDAQDYEPTQTEIISSLVSKAAQRVKSQAQSRKRER